MNRGKLRRTLINWTIAGSLITWTLFIVDFLTGIENRSEVERNALTIQSNKGRLGNQMCLYAVLYGLSTLNNRNMSIMPFNFENLVPYFNITDHIVNLNTFKERNSWNITSHFRPKDAAISRTTNIIKGYLYPCSYTFFDHCRKHIIRFFRFRTHIQNYAQQALMEIRGNRTNITFVGIHVRRTDYLRNTPGSWLKAYEGNEVNLEYFNKATNYYQEKYPHSLFIAVSDDRTWCHKNLESLGVHVIEDSLSPAHDMAILANCNHTIMTYGTFGFWGSYLAGGEVVYFDKFLKPGTEFLRTSFQFENLYLPDWIGITTNSSFVQKRRKVH